jgi:spore maturation protein CgeB
MGCRGLAIADCVPFYSDLFSEDELLVPRNMDEYREFVHLALTDPDLNERYRVKGYEAVLSRHTYAHRAQLILELIGAAGTGVRMVQ